MKKTLITALLASALAIPASAADIIYDLPSITTETPGASESDKLDATLNGDGMISITLAEGSQPTDFYAGYTSNTADLTITFTLNLSKFWKDTHSLSSGTISNKQLIGFEFTNKLGLFLSSSGSIDGYWLSTPSDSEHGSDRQNYALITPGTDVEVDATGAPLSSDFIVSSVRDDVYMKDGDYYTTLTTIVNQDGVKLYDQGGAILFNDSTLKAGANRTPSEVLLNPDYISSVVVTPFTINTGNIASTSKMIPEPATATLSLLALAGLAARRRRK